MQRFWNKVLVRGSGCWEWTGTKCGTKDYGQFWFGGRNLLAHRVAYELMVGEIPKGERPHDYVVMHKCDNPLCVNPEHLALGSQKDNLNDMRDKGRWSPPMTRGERINTAKLTESDVLEIRKIGNTMTRRKVAKIYGVHHSTITGIINRIYWTHI